MLSYDNIVNVVGPKEEIDFLLNEKSILQSLINPHSLDQLDDYLSTDKDSNLYMLRLSNLDTDQPLLEIIESLVSSLPNSHIKYEYLSSDDGRGGVLEYNNSKLIRKEDYYYKYSGDLQEFANRNDHLLADVFAFHMKDAFCYMENEEFHSKKNAQ